MTYPVSGCCFIRDALIGAFTIFETMASMLPLVDEFVVMDLGSTDGTLEKLELLARRNPKVRLVRGAFPVVDAGAFATLANDLVRMCKNEVVWYAQADETPHEHLLRLLEPMLAVGKNDLSFWRVQLGYNFQEPRWYPHLVHRIGPKDDFHFVGDGMNTDRVFGVDVCSTYNAGWFSRWGELGENMLKTAINEMILDVSLLGGFRDNIPVRRALHAPFWKEQPVIPYRFPGETKDRQLPADQWMEWARRDDRWTRQRSPYNIPKIMEYHVGKVRYELRPELFEALCRDDTRTLLGV